MRFALFFIVLSITLVQCGKKVDYKNLETELINWGETVPADSSISAKMIGYYPVYKTSFESDEVLYCAAAIIQTMDDNDTLIILSLSREDDFIKDVLEEQGGSLETQIDDIKTHPFIKGKKLMVNAAFNIEKAKTYFGNFTFIIR